MEDYKKAIWQKKEKPTLSDYERVFGYEYTLKRILGFIKYLEDTSGFSDNAMEAITNIDLEAARIFSLYNCILKKHTNYLNLKLEPTGPLYKFCAVKQID